jgi:hypothetical protein
MRKCSFLGPAAGRAPTARYQREVFAGWITTELNVEPREIETEMLSLVRPLINRCRQCTKLNIYRIQTSRILRKG